MKKRFAYFFLIILLILSFTACRDSVDIIISEAPTLSVSEPIPEEITIAASEAVTDDVQYIETENVTTSQTVTVTTEMPPRPSIEELFEFYRRVPADISFEAVDETDETILAKQYMAQIWKADTFCSAALLDTALDEYIDNGYLKDYIKFKFKIWYEDTASLDNVITFYDIPLIEAVEQKQAGDTIYIYVKGLERYYLSSCGEWISRLGKNWVGIRNGKVVNEGYFVDEDEYKLIGIEKTSINEYGEPAYPFPPERNPWDNMEDIKKIYDGLKAQGYDIEMKDYPLSD